MRQNSIETLPSIGIVQTKDLHHIQVVVFSKLDGVTMPKVGQWTIVGGNPEVYQRTEDNLHVEVFFDNPYA